MNKYMLSVAFFLAHIGVAQAQEAGGADQVLTGRVQIQEDIAQEQDASDKCPNTPFNIEIQPVRKNKWVSKKAIDELKKPYQSEPLEIERIKDGIISHGTPWGIPRWSAYDAERGIFVEVTGYSTTGRGGPMPERPLQPDEFLRHIVDEGRKRNEIVKIVGATQNQQVQMACLLNRTLAAPEKVERVLPTQINDGTGDYSIVHEGNVVRYDDYTNIYDCSSSACKELFQTIYLALRPKKRFFK